MLRSKPFFKDWRFWLFAGVPMALAVVVIAYVVVAGLIGRSVDGGRGDTYLPYRKEFGGIGNATTYPFYLPVGYYLAEYSSSSFVNATIECYDGNPHLNPSAYLSERIDFGDYSNRDGVAQLKISGAFGKEFFCVIGVVSDSDWKIVIKEYLF